MYLTIFWPGRRRIGGLLFLLAATAAFVPGLQAARFKHATLDRVEIYTSDSAENTARFLSELLEIRRQIQDLVAPVPLPNPRMQIVILAKFKDYEEFRPDAKLLEIRRTAVSGFTASEYGLIGSAVMENGPGYEFGRDALRLYYASYLLQSAVPDAPLWIRVGLPEFFATTDCVGNRIRVGGDFMGHRGALKPAKLLPLAELMNDAAMEKFYNAPKHDNALYEQSWLLWQQWLANPDPARRAQVNRLFAAIRSGRPADLPAVAEVFGESGDAINAAHRAPKTARGFPPLESNPDAAALVRELAFAPATDFDGHYARAMLAGQSGKGPAALAYALHQALEADPASPRPLEALAVLAMGEEDYAGALSRWAEARERGTDNPYAYLLPVRQALATRPFYLNLESQLPATACEIWRRYLDLCVKLDPGNAEAHFYRTLVEAFAPQPDGAALDAIERSHTLAVRPLGYLYLAIGRWRQGEKEAAHRILADLQSYGRLPADGRGRFTALDNLMRQREAAKN